MKKPYTFVLMSFGNRLQPLLHIATCLVAFAIPFPFIFGSLSVVLLVLLWLLRGDFRGTWQRLRGNPILWAWILYFVLHAVSYTYSTDKGDSLFDLQTKLSFLVLPIAIGAGAGIDRRQLEQIFLSFVAGVTVIAVFCLAQAGVLYSRSGDAEVFFYHPLVRGLNANAVYTAWYVICSISILVLFDWTRFQGLARKLLWFLVLMIQFVFFVLLSSKSLLVLFFFFLMPVYYIKHFRLYPPAQRVLMIGSMLAVAATIFFSNDLIKSRYEEILDKDKPKVAAEVAPGKPPSFNNLSLRLFLWKVGIEKISEDRLWLTGVGNGDVHLELNRAMYEAGITNMYDSQKRSHLYNVNLHNMYIQSLFMLGIPGLVTFLFMIFAPFAALRRVREKTIFFVFQLTGMLYMMQESALQTQAGILFFTFFSMVFWNQYCHRQRHMGPAVVS
jgi:O-antigen ligase